MGVWFSNDLLELTEETRQHRELRGKQYAVEWLQIAVLQFKRKRRTTGSPLRSTLLCALYLLGVLGGKLLHYFYDTS